MKAGKRILSFALVLLLAAQVPLTVFAVNVTLNPGDAGGLNSAVSTVASGSDVENLIKLNSGIYNKPTDRTSNITFVNKTLTVRGVGGAYSDVIIDGQGTGYLFYVTGVRNLLLKFENLTLTKGYCSSGTSWNSYDNFTGNGAAIYNAGGSLYIVGCMFSDNTATNYGGAVYNDSGTVTITGSIFSGNTAANGGAVYNDSGTVTITGSTFSGNTAANGGAVYNNSGDVTIIDSAVTGGIYNDGALNINYGSTVDAIDGGGTTKFEVLFEVTGIGGNLTAAAGGSPITSGDFAESGNQLEFTATPASGYRVKQWTVKQWADSGSATNPTGDTYGISSLSSPYKVMVEFEMQAAEPTASPAGGTYGTAQAVTLSCTTPGATIYYTLDGSDPTVSGTRQTYSAPIIVPMGTTLKACGAAANMADSAVMEETYTQMGAAAPPTASPTGGIYTAAQAVTLSCATPGATIYYTLDGSNSDNNSSEYTTPITVDSDTVIKAIAYAPGMTESAVMSESYHISTEPPPSGQEPYVFVSDPMTLDLNATKAKTFNISLGSSGIQADIASDNPAVAGVSPAITTSRSTNDTVTGKAVGSAVVTVTFYDANGEMNVPDNSFTVNVINSYSPPSYSGDSGSDSGGRGSSTQDTVRIVTAPQPVTTTQAKAAYATALQVAKESGGDTVNLTLRGDFSEIPLDILQALTGWAKRDGMAIRLTVDVTKDSSVTARYILDPSTAERPVSLLASADSPSAINTAARFRRWFTNKLTTIATGQEGSFGIPVDIAVKVDLTDMDAENLYFYSYDSKTNTYRRIEKPAYWIDKNGYLHFTIEYGGEIVISDGLLERK